MTKLKRLNVQSIPAAVQKAERYRLLNEAAEAESICRDVLLIEPRNQEALAILILALSDQYDDAHASSEREIRELLPRLEEPYHRAYYAGITAERKAKAKLREHTPGASSIAYDLLQEAMRLFEEAERIRPPGNDDALLRWNTCVRIIERHMLKPSAQDWHEPPLE